MNENPSANSRGPDGGAETASCDAVPAAVSLASGVELAEELGGAGTGLARSRLWQPEHAAAIIQSNAVQVEDFIRLLPS